MPHADPPAWLAALAWVSLGVAFLCAALILADIYLRGHRQKMGIMEVVWPVTALYFGPLAFWAYQRWGRPQSPQWQGRHGMPPGKSFPATVAVAVSHCGAGCTLGDIIGGWIIFAGAFEIAGASLWPEYIADCTLAFSLGIAFQYFSIAPMRGLGVREGILAALKADTLSLTAFEMGLFGWMALVQLVWFPAGLHPDDPVYWFLMQIGMVLGFITAYPVNAWLLTAGIKEAM
ncbi:MAG TPA: DUF4396 domain-containing protein [Rhodanobacteraceae bacterium]|nr:DUF4396 domain-containing protein [Rhodanobacteraceae bacterium]